MPHHDLDKPDPTKPVKTTPIVTLPDAWIEALVPAIRLAALAAAVALAHWLLPPL